MTAFDIIEQVLDRNACIVDRNACIEKNWRTALNFRMNSNEVLHGRQQLAFNIINNDK